MIGMMALGLVMTSVVSAALQYGALSQRVDSDLEQEVSELTLLAQNGPDRDGSPYTDVAELFTSYLATTVPGEEESILAMIEGEPALRSGGDRPFDIFHPDVRAEITSVPLADGHARLTSLRTQGTTLRMLIADVQLPEEAREAQFVVAIDLGRQQAEINRRWWTYSAVSLISLIVAGAIAWAVLGRLLRPLRELGEATAEISTDDLSRRISVDGSDTEVQDLAVRFNTMLDRIEEGVEQQRQFLDDAAHELRTPLTILRGNIELMRYDDPEEVSTTRVLLMDEVDRMQRLVDDLLMLARSQRPDFLRPVPSDVTELAFECMDRITALGERSWKVRADAEGTLLLDRHRVIQAVVQLASNAVRYSATGSAIELATRWVEADSREARRAVDSGAQPARRFLEVSLQDEGIGIPAEQLERIFDRFGRADNAVSREGSGLGLAIVEAIVTAHGGAAQADSTVGSGSTLTLWFPDW